MASIRMKYPNFSVILGKNSLTAVGKLQPTSRSNVYTVEIKYHFRKDPTIHVLRPELIVNFNGEKIPHTYPGNALCLFRPKYAEFKYSDYISTTIIPWTSLWLYYYEVWHVTGEWLGGGEHPNEEKS